MIKQRVNQAIVGAALTISAGATAAADIAPHSGVAAPHWTALFDAPFGSASEWSGADGVMTIPLSGDERHGSGSGRARTLIWFGDTFVGGVNPDGSRIGGTVMVNNSHAVITGNDPVAAAMAFNVKRDAQARAVAMVVPKPVDTWYWPMDGVTLKAHMFTYAVRMRSGTGGVFNFATDGVDLLAARAVDAVPYAGGYKRRALPLFVPAVSEQHGEIVMGTATLAQTRAAGSAAPDGYIYIYGTRSDAYNKKLLVGRVAPRDIANGQAYRFWNGNDWGRSLSAAKPIAGRLGADVSVTRLADGRYLAVHQMDGLGADIAVRYGPAPQGPFGPPIIVWTCPETQLTPNAYVYNAKAHPNLSKAGELLISYNVNSFDFWEHFGPGGAAIYRPRFITVPLPD